MSAASSKPLTAPAVEAVLESRLATSQRLTAEDLRRAIDGSQLVVHYQPQVLAAGHDSPITGVEALLRWAHPHYGLLFPEAFTGLAERHGLIGALTDFVLETGVDQIAAWNGLGLTLDLSVKLNSTLVNDAAFPARLRELLAARRVDPAQLTLEVKEGADVENPFGLTEILARLRDAGSGLSLDDFGAGHSSLTGLCALPFTEVKIDRSLGRDLAGNDSCRGIVRAIIDFSHHIGLEVCCEGIESAAALDFLRDAGCDHAQGDFIARPMTAEGLARWLAGADDGALRKVS